MPWIHEVDAELGQHFTQHVMTVGTAKALNPNDDADGWRRYSDDAIVIVCADENDHVVWVSVDDADVPVGDRISDDVANVAPINDWR